MLQRTWTLIEKRFSLLRELDKMFPDVMFSIMDFTQTKTLDFIEGFLGVLIRIRNAVST